MVKDFILEIDRLVILYKSRLEFHRLKILYIAVISDVDDFLVQWDHALKQ